MTLTAVHRLLPRLVGKRAYAASSLNVDALDKWTTSGKHVILEDNFGIHPVSDLYVTLPTRDGTKRAYESPKVGSPLGYGHHLAFFHARHPEAELRPDGTEGDFCPPPPFTRRMWAGGKIKWKKPLVIGQQATALCSIGGVEKKGFEKGSPIIFVNQKIEVKMDGTDEVALEEERAHVYLPPGVNKRVVREVSGLPSPDFSFKFTPTPITLFRFSALMFNAHHIHLDKQYAQEKEGYPERLVHGPLTALMLLETLTFHYPDARLKSFEYRARNPVIVDRPLTILGAWENKTVAQLWTEDAEGVVGMTGKVTL